MIKNDYAYWENIWGLFEDEHRRLSEQAVGWYPSGRHQIVIQYENGRRDVYNSVLSNKERLRTVYDPNKSVSYEELSEEAWMREFSIILKHKLRVLRIDQETLSELTGISRVSISKYVNGKAIPSTRNIELIARALQCSTEELRVDYYDEIERR